MYQPDQSILKKYADILVKFALNSGHGIKPGDTVQCFVPDVAKPLFVELHRSILEAGGHPMMRLIATGIDKDFFELANEDQLTYFPRDYMKARIDVLDHSIGIIAEHNMHELKDVDPAKLMKSAEARKEYRTWANDKEYSGKFTWTLALYGTEAMAAEAGMSLEDYWQQIIQACFLDADNPVAEWEKIQAEQQRVMKQLNSMQIDKIHIVAEKTDLWIRLGEKRRFVGGSGRNIPSFEIFTSPDWRGTQGHIYFNQPLYRYGNLVKDAYLEFKDGLVVKATASQGEKLLKQIVARPNADKIGEYSLTDSRASRITKFMANTLFDENIGGRFGNTHLAVGMSYKDCYDGDPTQVKKEEWEELGFNDSGEHTDIISTTDRTVTATLKDCSERIIYQDGKFTV